MYLIKYCFWYLCFRFENYLNRKNFNPPKKLLLIFLILVLAMLMHAARMCAPLGLKQILNVLTNLTALFAFTSKKMAFYVILFKFSIAFL